MFAQNNPTRSGARQDSVTIVPGAQYGRSSFLKFFSGAGYRDLWTVPIEVPLADFSAMAGGLAPLRLGGGMTTQTLHVTGNDGRRYVFRSVQKYAGQALAEELRGTLFEAIVQDQFSAFHPSGALVLPTLLDAVDVLHVTPELYVLPDDERLGEFRELMANDLVTFEERPEEATDSTPGFADSRRILDTEDFLAELEDDAANRLDVHGYLTARLVDLLVGDRDRSVNNWWWARFDGPGYYLWRSLPRDRDQAFVQFDGFTKALLRIYEPRLTRFSVDVPSVPGLTRNAWDMDRPLLSTVEKVQWDSVVVSVQQRLSDDVITQAVRHMPPEHFELNGQDLARQLRARRDRLQETGDAFYRLVSEYADIHTTDMAEDVVIEWLNDGRVSVSVEPVESRNDDPTGMTAGGPRSPLEGEVVRQAPPFLRRTFSDSETREVRLYLHGGDDRVVVRGSGQRTMMLRIIGGGGADALADSSTGGGQRSYFYDGGDRTVVTGPGTKHINRDMPRPQSWGESAAESPDWGSRWVPLPAFPYTTDLGLLLSMGAGRTSYGFGKDPYSSALRFSAGFAPREGKFIANVSWEVRDVLDGVNTSFALDYSGIETLNYFGFGNDTEPAEDDDFNELSRGRLMVRPLVSVALGDAAELSFGARFEVSDTDTVPDDPDLVSTTRPYGSGRFRQGGVEASLRLDTRDQPIAATRGLLAHGQLRTYAGILDVDGAFSTLTAEASTYLSPGTSGNQVLALRAAAEKTWGTLPYYEAAFLGGPMKLRGFRRERFAGDASVFGSAEVRLGLGQVGIMMPWHVGVFGFGDAGKVFVSGQSDGGWHTSWGGGLSMAPIDRRFTGSITIARSPEGTTLYIGSGFGF